MQPRLWNVAGAAGRLGLLVVVLWPEVMGLWRAGAVYLRTLRARLAGAAGPGALLGRLLATRLPRIGLALLAGAWWAAEELLVVGCNAAFLLKPWPVVAGQSACTGLLGMDLSPLGLLVAALLAVALARR